VLSYWEGLRRAGNEIPFWDDLKLLALTQASPRLLLIDVLTGPERFRFNLVGNSLRSGGATELKNRFS
jgi:hypothetical protein